MKPTNLTSASLVLMISGCLLWDLGAQPMHIPHVPDFQQPIVAWWGNHPENTCAPAAAANICVYWDSIIHHSNAEGLNNRNVPFLEYIPSYLYWFLGTNGGGDSTRANPSVYGYKPGTMTIDIDTGLQEYVRWDATHPFKWPMAMPAKKGFDWDIKREEGIGFPFHVDEILMRRPDIVVFKYWNPVPTGVVMPSDLGGDSIHFFLWGAPVDSTRDPNPIEDFYFDEEQPNSVGHAVTGVGFIMGWDPDDAGPLPMTDWLICHDNWPGTPVNIAIPWIEPDPNWIATISVDPGLDTIYPYISCKDTTVYLDSDGQYHMDVSYIVDSVWDNNGIEQLFIDVNDVYCYHTDSAATRKAGAMDMFGNLSQCTAKVTVLDTISPLPLCRDTTVYLDASGMVTIDSSYLDVGSTDNCEVATITISRNSFTCTDVGPNIIDVTVCDVNSNSSKCQATVTLLDTISPVALCKDTTVYLDETGEFTIDSSYLANGSTDNCSISTVELSQSSFDCTDPGSNKIDITVTDASSNFSQCQATVTVLDTLSPVAVCSDTTVYLDETGEFTIDSSYLANGSADNCGISTMQLSETSFTCEDIGTNSVSVTVEDINGNSSVCIVQVTVLDTVSPALTCTDTTVYLDNTGSFTIDSSFLILAMSDHCGLSHSILSRSEFNTGDLASAQAVSVTLYDESGNSSTCNVLVTVLDTISSALDKQIFHTDNFEFVVIPNPSGGFFRIESKTPVNDCALEIYNLNGTLLLYRKLPEGKAEIDISDFSPGVYVLKVTGKKDMEYRQGLILK